MKASFQRADLFVFADVTSADLFSYYFPMQNIVLVDNQYFNRSAVQYRYLFRTNIECKVLISKYSRSNFVMQI